MKVNIPDMLKQKMVYDIGAKNVGVNINKNQK